MTTPLDRSHQIFHVIEVLHGDFSGAADTLDPAGRQIYLEWLSERVRVWSALPNAPWSGYDLAVQELCRACLAEHGVEV